MTRFFEDFQKLYFPFPVTTIIYCTIYFIATGLFKERDLYFEVGVRMYRQKGKTAKALPVIAISEQLCHSAFSLEQKENIIDMITGA